MTTTVIRVVARTAKVRAQPVNPVKVTPGDGARVVVVTTPGLRGPAGAPGDGTGVYGETPTGVKNGINTTFTLAHIPAPGSTAVYRNGLRELLGTGYTVSGSELTFSAAPLSSDEITVDYLLES